MAISCRRSRIPGHRAAECPDALSGRAARASARSFRPAANAGRRTRCARPRSARSSGQRARARARCRRSRRRAGKGRADRACARTACVAKRGMPRTLLAVAALPASRSAARQRGQRRVAMAAHHMVVDHARRLHEGIDDARADELEATPRELLGHRSRDRRFRRHLRGGAEAIDLGPAADEIPKQPREARTLFHCTEIRARGENRALDLHAIADDARILHQLLDLLRRVARDLLGLEAVEGAAEILALAQDSDPGQSGLEAVEDELLIERAVVVFGHAPFLVVIGDVERVLLGPGTAFEAIRMEEGRAHSAAFASPGHTNCAQAGLTSCNLTPPATSGSPAASAWGGGSSRSTARPRPGAPEPSVPMVLSPALTGMPASGAKPSKATGSRRVRAVPRCSMRETTSCPTKHPLSKSMPLNWSMSASCGNASP